MGETDLLKLPMKRGGGTVGQRGSAARPRLVELGSTLLSVGARMLEFGERELLGLVPGTSQCHRLAEFVTDFGTERLNITSQHNGCFRNLIQRAPS